MMRSYCTLFDKNYLVQAMALYRSLLNHAGEFTLYALCMDDEAYEFFQKTTVPSLVPLELACLYTAEVLKVKERTTHGQFCWVCQPLLCLHVLDRYNVEMVTYLEADSLFFGSPEPLFEELHDYSVSLVPHRFPPRLDYSAESGKYCVQFNAFRNDEYARSVLTYWKNGCFRYMSSKPLHYPGQKTLDQWIAKFPRVREISHPGAGVAPWNVMQYKLEKTDAGVTLNSQPVIFYHYHQYLRYEDGSHELGEYPLPDVAVEYFYKPYINLLADVQEWLQTVDSTFVYRKEKMRPKGLRQVLSGFIPKDLADWLFTLRRKIRGIYNVYPDQRFIR